MNKNSIRDVVKNSIREDLSNHFHIDISEADADLVDKIADGGFEVLAIEKKEQGFRRESGCFIWMWGA